MSRISLISILTLVVIAAWLRNEMILLIAIILALVAGVSHLWTRYCLTALSYERRFGTTRLYPGDETELLVEITNAKPMPLPWLRIDDGVPKGITLATSHLSGSERSRLNLVNVLGMRWYERVTRRYKLHANQRGAWRFGPARLRSGDIFGFNIQHRNDENSDEILIYPRVLPVITHALPANHPLGDRRSRRRVMDDPLRIMSVRDYAIGDNFRHIHWKATARRQTLQTKLFEPSASVPVAIFLNINTDVTPAYGYNPEVREFAISAAASLAQHLWKEGKTVGLICNASATGTAHHVRVQPANGQDQLQSMLSALARIDDGWARWPIEALLAVEAPSLPYGATIVTITPVMTRRLTQTLIDLRRRQYGVVLLTLGDAALSGALPNIHAHHLVEGDSLVLK